MPVSYTHLDVYKRQLLETADVFVTNNRDKSLKKMGIDYASLKERFPRLVYVTCLLYTSRCV